MYGWKTCVANSAVKRVAHALKEEIALFAMHPIFVVVVDRAGDPNRAHSKPTSPKRPVHGVLYVRYMFTPPLIFQAG